MANWSDARNAQLVLAAKTPLNDVNAGLAAADSEAIGLRDIGRFFRKNWLFIVAGAAAAITLALGYTVLKAPTFRASASVLFDPNDSSALLKDERWQSVETSAKIDSQVEIIKSGRVATSVVQSLSLITDPEFGGGQGIEAAVVSLTNRLNVRRIGQSTALEISITSDNPDKSAKIANAVAQAYIDVALQDKSNTAQNGAKWLESRLDYLRKQAFGALLQVENFRTTGSGTATDSRVKFAELESIAQTYRKMYDSFLLKYFEAEQIVSYPVADARPLSSATAGLAEKSPKTGVILIFAALAGAFAGLALALIRQALDQTIQSPTSIPADSRIAFNGFVRHAGKASRRAHIGGARGRPILTVNNTSKHSSCDDREFATLIEAPPSQVTDDMRRIRSSILATMPTSASRFIGITSVGRSEGKTTVAINLATQFGASGYRTLLVDGCVSNPSATRSLASSSTHGFYDAIREKVPAQAFILSDLPYGFSFLPIGSAQGSRSLGDFLDGPETKSGFDNVRAAFDVVIIDLSALSDTSETISISSALDAVLVVVEAGKTRIADYQEQMSRLMVAPPKFVGWVLNKTTPDAAAAG